uniref:Uncharacterized protein n=1 Tax=Anopheles maculatus TaxID=74869 RepID=A0A182SY93_9DIPT
MSLAVPSIVRLLLLLCALATLLTVRGGFVALRASTSNRTLLCWAIKLSPAAYVTDAECVRSYQHQIVMIYGDITPGPTVRERLGRKVASLRQPLCQHRVPAMVLTSASDGNRNRSVLDQTVRNFIASYTMLSTERTLTCRECQVLAIRRILPCPVNPGTVVLYTDCLKQLDSIDQMTLAAAKHRDAWVWQFRRKLKATLYPELERLGRERKAMLNFMTTAGHR